MSSHQTEARLLLLQHSAMTIFTQFLDRAAINPARIST
jgi:hypothetical protein